MILHNDNELITPYKPVIVWDNNQIFSLLYNDIYFSRQSGYAESNHVFIQGNQLPTRFKAMKQDASFVVGETGFGTGLNFINCWQCFEQYAPRESKMVFVSFEKHPLKPSDINQALSSWPKLQSKVKQLTSSLPAVNKGVHQINLSQGQVQLILVYGDIQHTIEQQYGLINQVDAWFLDGFAPSKNPEMWGQTVLQHIANYSKKAATFATFTAARLVKDNLIHAGFFVKKIPGFGKKRDMLIGKLSTSRTIRQQPSTIKPWFRYPLSPVAQSKHTTAVVIGAGMAGCSTARALADKGFKVFLLDQHQQPCEAASGNPQGILYPKLSRGNTVLRTLIIQGYWHTIAKLKQQKQWHPSGLIQLAFNEKELQKQIRIIQSIQPNHNFFKAYSAQELSEISDIRLTQSGLYFPKGSWLCPKAWFQRCIDHPLITFYGCHKVSKVSQSNNRWTVHFENHGLTALSEIDTVVIANAHGACRIDQTSHLPLKSIRGQITQLNETNESRKLKVAICADGYVTPSANGFHHAGATFTFDDDYPHCRLEEHKSNISKLKNYVPFLSQALNLDTLDLTQVKGRANFRCTTPDYLPIAGEVINAEAFSETFSYLKKNAKYQFGDNITCPVVSGLYVNVGHGSRGLITAPLLADFIASLANQEPLPLDSSLIQAIHPARFLARALARSAG